MFFQLGDPTVGGNLPPCPVAIENVVANALKKPHEAGYANACGIPEARRAIADYHSYPEHSITSDNVIVANGCSGALELALTALLDEDMYLLVPQPGFPLYQVIAESHGAKILQYRLKLTENNNWECDMEHLRDVVSKHHRTNRIGGIVVNNPSNPTGAVFSERHLTQILDFAAENRLPIVADEVYRDLTFGNNIFHPMAKIAGKMGRIVPVITASGLAKQYLLPGWRVGWVTFHDNIYGSLREVELGANRLAQVILGASCLVQSVIPNLLIANSPNLIEWKQDLRMTLEHQASFLCDKLARCQALNVILPQGAMYAMVEIDCTLFSDIQNDIEFSSKLLKEENVFVLPGSAFGMTNVFRVVYCSPESFLDAAATRISNFVERHINAEGE